MKEVINVPLTRIDSPDYRNEIIRSEHSILALEAAVKSLIKNVKAQMEIAQEFSAKNVILAGEISALSKLESDEPVVETALEKFAVTIAEIEKSRKMMLRQMQDVFVEPLEGIVKKDIANIKELKRTFDKSSDTVDSSLDRYLNRRIKDPLVPEHAEEVAAQRHDFQKKSIKYSNELNSFQYKRRSDILENVLALMYTNFSFFHQGYDLLRDMEPVMRELTSTLNGVRKIGDEIYERTAYEQTEILEIPASAFNPSTTADPANGVAGRCEKSGFLVKKGSGKITQVWSRRWFEVKGNYFMYTTRGKEEQPTLAANLRLCTVKPCASDVNERRYCFELVSPVKSYILQAENDVELRSWIEVLQNAIGRALNSDNSSDNLLRGMSSKEKLNDSFFENLRGSSEIHQVDAAATLAAIKNVPGNHVCADCGSENPEWASINLGILLCIECSGIHRSLGVQISKVRSLTLDRWEPEVFEVMLALGNTKVNDLFEEGCKSSTVSRPDAKSPRADKEKWIGAKYVTKQFIVAPDGSGEFFPFANENMWQSAAMGDLIGTLKYIALGADVDWKNMDNEGKTALLHSIDNQNSLMTHYMLTLNADPAITTSSGWNALHFAASNGDEKLVKLLLKRNVKATDKNAEGHAPIDIAIQRADPEVVTILRMHQFDAEQQSAARHSTKDADDQVISPDSASEGDRKLSPTKSKTSYGSGSRAESPNRLSNQKIDSNSAKAAAIVSSSLSSASSMANNAARFFKTNFNKLHSEVAPPAGGTEGVAGSPESEDRFRPPSSNATSPSPQDPGQA